MKNKKLIIAFLILSLGTTFSVKAQSSLEYKLKADLEQSRKHGKDLLMKAQEQQSQARNEKKSTNLNASQQSTNATPVSNQKNTEVKQQPNSIHSKQMTSGQLVPNHPGKKEE